MINTDLMKNISVLQSRRFARQFKKLHHNTKKCVESEVRLLIANPLLGTPKKGDLAALRVHKFYCQNQHYLLGYCVDDNAESIILEVIQSHENFYRDLKR